MTMEIAKQKKIAIGALGMALALGSLQSSSEAADRADATRYPYDPVCAWGRIADGRGMLVRCLTRVEAQALPTKSAKAGGSGRSAAKARDARATEAPRSSAGREQGLEVTVGPVLVEQGTLKAAERKLRDAADRYVQCVKQHGGLTRKEGEVRVRFLVRERGRAEGVGVFKRRSVNQAAARCIADVVDRRYVGLPDAPLVAATLVIKFRRQAK